MEITPVEITILSGAYRAMVDHALGGYPHEVVGILAGSRETGLVSRVVALVNERADSPQNRYQVSSLMLMRAEQALEQENLEVVGYYHTHPDHPAQYSEFDREHALPNMSYVILSVQGQIPEIINVLAWRLTEDRTQMVPDKLTLTPKED